jgi:hypothetical protein
MLSDGRLQRQWIASRRAPTGISSRGQDASVDYAVTVETPVFS